MKTKILLLIFTLFSIATWGQIGFPVRSADTAVVKIKDKVTTRKHSLDWALKHTAHRYSRNLTSAGAFNDQVGSPITLPDWRSVAKPTVVSGKWYDMSSGAIYPAAGRCLYIERIVITVTDSCTVAMKIGEQGINYAVDGNTNAPLFTGNFHTRIDEISDAAGGKIIWDFGDNYLRIPYKSIVSFYYSRKSTVGTNFSIKVFGYEITNDENWDAEYLEGVFGDSIGAATGEDKDPQSSRRNGNRRGLWPFLVNDYLKEHGVNALLSNVSIGGTGVAYWEARVSDGLFRNWQPDIVHCNLGANDNNSDAYISSTSGVDGIYKVAMKTIITDYFRNVPKGCFIANQITDSDLPVKLVNVASGIYAGQTRIAALRQELIALVNELKALHPTWDLHLANTGSNIFTASQKSYYVASEQSVGASIHPNASLGYPAMSAVIEATIAGTAFFSRNSN